MAAPSALNVNINGVMNGMMNAMQSMQQTMLGLQQTVIKLINDKNTTPVTEGNSLSTACAALREGQGVNVPANINQPCNSLNVNNGGYRFPVSEFGVPSECIPHIDIVSDSLKKKIWEGKDVNLAALLIPKHESDKAANQDKGAITVNLSNLEDSRLHRKLTISEFITAFGKYKRVMCVKYPERRVELDRYEANIIDISNVYGPRFYDYHCEFSARAAAAVRDSNIKVDWSIKDNSLLTMVTSNARVNVCSPFCPQLGIHKNTFNNHIVPNKSYGGKEVDRYGRKRVVYNDKEICNNFNERRCISQACQYAHICSVCYAGNHGANSCNKKKVNKLNSGPETGSH